MAAPQLSDPGTSDEWFPTVEERSRTTATARRQRFQRIVTYAMVGLTAFAVLGLISFAWRRSTLKADLEARPPLLAQAAPAAQPAPVAALDKDIASPPAPPVSDTPVALAATPPTPAVTPVAAKPVAKKAPARSPFLKSLKAQPASIKRR